MTGIRQTPRTISDGRGSHSAVRAWKHLAGTGRNPDRVEVIKDRDGSAIYRLVGARPDGGSVIAKQASLDEQSPEVVVHLNVHPQLDLRTVRCYGFQRETSREPSTLFLEDVGGTKFSPQFKTHRVLAGRWLASLHCAFVGSGLASQELDLLPGRGPGHYLDLLQQTRRNLSDWKPAPVGDPSADLRQLLLARCDEIEYRWPTISALCAHAPETLVHGDLCRQNMFVTASAHHSRALVPVDWEEAGIGPPAVDLAQLPSGHTHFAAGADLATYVAGVKPVWPSLDLQLATGLAAAGTVFRGIAATFWATESVSFRWWDCRAVHALRVYLLIVSGALTTLASYA